MSYLIRRTLAYLIDCIIAFGLVMGVIQLMILSPIRENWGIDTEWMKDPFNMHLYVLLSISIPVYLYFALQDKNTKGTLGKRFIALQISQKDGSPIGFAKAFLRTIIKLLPWEIAHMGVIYPQPMYYQEAGELRILSLVGLLLLLIYFLSIVFSAKSQSLYDVLLGSFVKQKMVRA